MAEKDTATKTESTAKADSAGDSPAKSEAKTDGADKTDKTEKTGGGSSESGRGERQKVVSDAYRDNWHDIFGKTRRRPKKK